MGSIASGNGPEKTISLSRGPARMPLRTSPKTPENGVRMSVLSFFDVGREERHRTRWSLDCENNTRPASS